MRVKTQNNREKSMKLKASSLKKINKIDKSLSRLTKKKEEIRHKLQHQRWEKIYHSWPPGHLQGNKEMQWTNLWPQIY